MTKRELIDEITMRNPTAKPEFLSRFDETDLGAYLDHLIVARRPRLSGGGDRYSKYFITSEQMEPGELPVWARMPLAAPAPAPKPVKELVAPAQPSATEEEPLPISAEPVRVTQADLFIAASPEPEMSEEEAITAPADQTIAESARTATPTVDDVEPELAVQAETDSIDDDLDHSEPDCDPLDDLPQMAGLSDFHAHDVPPPPTPEPEPVQEADPELVQETVQELAQEPLPVVSSPVEPEPAAIDQATAVPATAVEVAVEEPIVAALSEAPSESVEPQAEVEEEHSAAPEPVEAFHEPIEYVPVDDAVVDPLDMDAPAQTEQELVEESAVEPLASVEATAPAELRSKKPRAKRPRRPEPEPVEVEREMDVLDIPDTARREPVAVVAASDRSGENSDSWLF